MGGDKIPNPKGGNFYFFDFGFWIFDFGLGGI
jgi:hypothetical protein